jgi:hypothetical protein
MKINYYIKNVYGLERIYISDPDVAIAIQKLTNQKTIDSRHIEALENLGFTFEQVLPPK